MDHLPPLATLPEAARELGVPVGSLRREAERLGLLIRMGRAIRVARADFGELIEGCRENPRAPASSSGATADSTCAMALSSSQRAREIAERLKRSSRATSRSAGGQLVRLTRDP